MEISAQFHLVHSVSLGFVQIRSVSWNRAITMFSQQIWTLRHLAEQEHRVKT